MLDEEGEEQEQEEGLCQCTEELECTQPVPRTRPPKPAGTSGRGGKAGGAGRGGKAGGAGRGGKAGGAGRGGKAGGAGRGGKAGKSRASKRQDLGICTPMA